MPPRLFSPLLFCPAVFVAQIILNCFITNLSASDEPSHLLPFFFGKSNYYFSLPALPTPKKSVRTLLKI